MLPASALRCPSALAPAFQPGLRQSPLASDEFLASKRLPVKRTAFDFDWNRVRHSGVSHRLASALVRDIPGPASAATLAAVNSWTNARVRYVEDSAGYGRADYWADASRTLRRGTGDCEDIAIAKMQLLAALGVPSSDMYLTIARDLVRNADHALLVVTLGERNWLLDNATDQVLDASQSHDYRPILSFSGANRWLHGYGRSCRRPDSDLIGRTSPLPTRPPKSLYIWVAGWGAGWCLLIGY